MTLRNRIIDSLNAHKDNVALDVDGIEYTYTEFYNQIKNINEALCFLGDNEKPVAILGGRSRGVYAGILASFILGKAYVPLNNDFPANRLSYILSFSCSDVLILCEESIPVFEQFAENIPSIKVLLLTQNENISFLREKHKRHKFYALDLDKVSAPEPVVGCNVKKLVYIMFTSGSTGNPKGVPVCEKNLTSYIDVISNKYDITSSDKLSQSFDVSFDLSVHDIFINFVSGATLCVVPKEQMFAPLKFINETVWFSVPSTILIMDRLRLLRPDSMPNLRLSLFCGEALPVDSALKWQKAASNSTIENLYGPTEATIAIFSHKFDVDYSYDISTVPIGKALSNNSYLIKDNDGNIVGDNQEGMLFLSGEQVVESYFNDEVQTNKYFLKDKSGKTWYKTGDLVVRLESKDLIYIGREDFQLKIGGFRVELEEIESVVKNEFNLSFAVALPLNLAGNNADGIILFLELGKESFDKETIIGACKNYLPKYMVPKNVVFLKEVPLTFNGKIDRKKLISEYCDEK